jgi:hypothetical protein
MLISTLMLLAGLMAAGVALTAAAAHAARGMPAHATSVMAGVAALDRGFIWRPVGILALLAFALALGAFCGGSHLAAFAGHRLLWRRRAEAPS